MMMIWLSMGCGGPSGTPVRVASFLAFIQGLLAPLFSQKATRVSVRRLGGSAPIALLLGGWSLVCTRVPQTCLLLALLLALPLAESRERRYRVRAGADLHPLAGLS